MGLIKQDLKKSVKQLIVVIALITCTFIPKQSFGRNISSMYTDKELEFSKAGYERNIRVNYEEVIKPILTKRELAVLSKVELEFPLKDKDRGDNPFCCYTKVRRSGRTIVIPVLTIKFLEDLSTSVAWLRQNDFTTETLPEYISMLKYQEAKRFNNGRYPPPLEALHIPSNALKDKEVDRIARNFLKTTAVYLLSREIGSLYFSRFNLGATELRTRQRPMVQPVALMSRSYQSEKKEFLLFSDDFALEVMRRIGTVPTGLSFYLSAQTYWTQNHIDFHNNEEAYRKYWHDPPEYAMFPERLYQIANLMVRGKEEYIRRQNNKDAEATQIDRDAREIYNLSIILEKKSIQWDIKQKASELKIEDLKPKRN